MPGHTPLEHTNNALRLHLHVAPRASRDAIGDIHDGRLKLAITAPPVDGKANDAIVRFLARKLRVKRSDIRLVSGETGKRKTLEIHGVSLEDARRKLGIT